MTQQETVCSLAATDAFGRSFGKVDTVDSKKKVGLFYFLWCGRHGSASQDNAKLTAEEQKSTVNIGVHHYWAEPLYGYYDSGDPWVIRKHVELFIMAGIDYLALDTTNGLYWETSSDADYRPAVFTLLDILSEYRAQGWSVPQIMFYTHTFSAVNVQKIYDAFYDTENNPSLKKYEPLWFNFEDTDSLNRARKPWIVADDDFDTLPEKVQERFYKKDSQWPNEKDSNGKLWMKDNGMPWMSWTSAKDGYKQYNHNGIMSVSIAQHTSGAFSDSVLLNSRDANRGRGFSQTDGTNNADRVEQGSNFQEQWDYAVLQGDAVNNIFITGWNEWVAQKQAPGYNHTECYFVDCFNEEFSRDAEMMKGGYGDAFYLQIANNIRLFKGLDAPGLQTNPWSTTIDIDGDLSQWEGTTGFLDLTGDTVKRSYKSANKSLPDYTDQSGRNDIASVRTTYDKDNLYFLVACVSDITEYDGAENWMNIFISANGVSGDNWENYQFVINRSVSGNTSSVERLQKDGASSRIGSAKIKRSGKNLIVSVPRDILQLNGEAFGFQFKIADHVTEYKDISDYYVSGDVAPIGRLNYSVRVK